ncbi:hypothetical protein F4680DRAFT_449895 [Xylaria scruposa]|nr:hypothetical protein F4680DRAFT_449895 [Xylaria scruposa]
MVVLADAHSAAMRKRFWPPAVSKGDSIQLAPLEIFPVQQMSDFHYSYVHLGDPLLKPEHFAANLLLYLPRLEEGPNENFNSVNQLFSLSSSPGSLSADPLPTTQVNSIPADNLRSVILAIRPRRQELALGPRPFA